MVRPSELRTEAGIRERDLHDLEDRREYERIRLANEVAIKIIRYRQAHGLSHAYLGRVIGMRQPHVARLEAGDHEPSLSTLCPLVRRTRARFQRRGEARSAEALEPGPREWTGYRRAQARLRRFIATSLSED